MLARKKDGAASCFQGHYIIRRGIGQEKYAAEHRFTAQNTGFGPCHALVFSTVGEQAALAATLPNKIGELRDLALIKELTVDLYDVFTVDLATDEMILYRVLWKEGIHFFYRKIVRIGDAGHFTHIVVGVGSEDEEILARRERDTLEKNLASVGYDFLTGLYTREAFLVRAAEFFRQQPDQRYDLCISRISNLELICHQYGRRAADRLVPSWAESCRTAAWRKTASPILAMAFLPLILLSAYETLVRMLKK